MHQDMAFPSHEVVTHSGNTLPASRPSPVLGFKAHSSPQGGNEDFEDCIDFAIFDRAPLPLQRCRLGYASSFNRK